MIPGTWQLNTSTGSFREIQRACVFGSRCSLQLSNRLEFEQNLLWQFIARKSEFRMSHFLQFPMAQTVDSSGDGERMRRAASGKLVGIFIYQLEGRAILQGTVTFAPPYGLPWT